MEYNFFSIFLVSRMFVPTLPRKKAEKQLKVIPFRLLGPKMIVSLVFLVIVM